MSFYKGNFNTEEELENYVKDKNYDTLEKPGVCVGIVITGKPGDWKVKLRYDDNDTGLDLEVKQIPSTRNEIVSTRIKYFFYLSYF